ncbi:hypothetical protein QFW77_16335 [Luteimonas sp. RD2P54]|uniref:Uncharacterized protein n=1 Tax=Luteimonas endophytica TaxID=3042023 RepID=A0ABT6JEB0_9GAMM|nr:hypothetical protein [Luteimonas endophytica]MDH5824543.1 hypothetical protein [Luteimonas endophytica]
MSVLMAFALAASSGFAPQQAVAGDLTNAVLECYVDTYAFDQPTANYCISTWTPWTADNPSVAHFEVVQLPAGNYSFAWKDRDTGAPPPGCGNTQFCSTGIATDVSGDGLVRMEVRITDHATGSSRTITADAHYFDGWH